MLEYFTDPVLRSPTIGSMLMCFVSGLTGVIVFLRKESLLGESLSHATYPGVILGVVTTALFAHDDHIMMSLGILTGAFSTALFGLYCIHLLQRHLNISADAALCFVLSAFFGIGLTLASRVQFTHTALYQQIQVYLYGQAATMTDIHIVIYGVMSLGVVTMILLIHKELQAIALDRHYAKSLGINVAMIDAIVFILIVLSVVIGIRSVGVVLISAMLIAPPVMARQFTNKMSIMFFLSGLSGLVSGFLGNLFSVEITRYIYQQYPGVRIVLPTGPMIVMVAATLCVAALMLAPERGLLIRLWRIVKFRYNRLCENILKVMWYEGEGSTISLATVQKYLNFSKIYMKCVFSRLRVAGWVKHVGHHKYQLTHDGFQRATHIVRLHRLWEVYLVDYLGVGAERVHRDADEMEHIITPELECELTVLLDNPERDPHHQPIPRSDEV